MRIKMTEPKFKIGDIVQVDLLIMDTLDRTYVGEIIDMFYWEKEKQEYVKVKIGKITWSGPGSLCKKKN